MNPNRNHYQVLGIEPSASEDEIRRAYKRLARTYHPDLNPKRPRSAHDRFRRLQDAYDVLSDPISRQQYDESLGIGPGNPQSNQAEQTETSDPWTVDIYQNEPRERWFDRWLDRFNWRRKLAVVVWALCVLGSFLPTSTSVVLSGTGRTVSGFREVSTTQRLLWISVPLVMIWVGSWMSNEDNFEGDRPALRVFGILLELIAWLKLVQLIGFYVIGPLILLVS